MWLHLPFFEKMEFLVSSFENEKANLRKALKKRRNAIAFDENNGQKIKDRFLEHFKFSAAQSIAGYWPMAGELDVVVLLSCLHQLGMTCALPVVEAADSPLVFKQWQAGDKLQNGPHGTRHPEEAAPIIEPDILLVPLLGFDLKGARLGFGGGYYDRTIEAIRSRKKICCIGVAFDEQQCSAVPLGPHDERLDWIVTPTRAIQCFR